MAEAAPNPKTITIDDLRKAITLLLPLLEMIASHTANKWDDLLVTVLRVIVSDNNVAQAVVDAVKKT